MFDAVRIQSSMRMITPASFGFDVEHKFEEHLR